MTKKATETDKTRFKIPYKFRSEHTMETLLKVNTYQQGGKVTKKKMNLDSNGSKGIEKIKRNKPQELRPSGWSPRANTTITAHPLIIHK